MGRRMLLLLSPDYLANVWQNFEACMIMSYGLNVGQYRAIPVVVRACRKLPPRYDSLVRLDLSGSDKTSGDA